MTHDTQALTLPQFLLARIADRETWLLAHRDDADSCQECAAMSPHEGSQVTTDRLLAECALNRRLVAGVQPLGEFDDLFGPEILAAMAAVYSGHPDYREGWEES